MKKIFTAIVCLMTMLVSVNAHNIHYPTYVVDGITYVQNNRNISCPEGRIKGCDIVKVDKPYDRTISIPYRLTINGERFQVCTIKENAFSSCVSMDSLILSEGLTISDRAFIGCKKLEYLYYSNCTYRTSIASQRNYYVNLVCKTLETNRGCCDETFWKEIGCSLEKLIIRETSDIKTRMDWCTKLKTIVCYAEIPPKSRGCSGCSVYFDEYQCSKITLYVPIESLEKYYFDSVWGEIDNIYPIDEMIEVTSINKITNNTTTDDAWYSINGIKVDEPTKGIYIKNGKKYLIK